MALKRYILVLFAAIIVLAGCQKSNQFTVKGKITHAEGEKIVLEKLLVASTVPVSESEINKNGEFKLVGETGIPTYYLLKLSESNFITLLIDSIDQIVVNADAANFSREYNVEGSLGSIQIKELNDNLNRTRSKLDSLASLNTLYKANANYDLMKPKIDEAYNKVIEEQVQFSTSFVQSNPFSMASVYALYQKLDANKPEYIIGDLQTMKTAASALFSIYPNSEHVKSLYNNALQFVQQEQAAKVQKFIQEQGQNSPDILLPGVDGNEIALSTLRGKVVLLQFWAAEDRPSRILNPLLVEAYKKYKRKGFDIYQVNVGENRSEWIDVIDSDKLTWTNVSDLKGCNKAVASFNIKTVPFNYLLDKEGKIIGKDLKGPGLDKALARALK